MYSEFAKRQFIELQGTDFDYLLIVRTKVDKELYSTVPLEGKYVSWENIEDAITWHFNMGYNSIEIYDLYATVFETSMTRMVKKTNKF